MPRPQQPQAVTSVLVKPAGADCNLACDYCFYRPKAALYPGTSRPRMNQAVLEALIGQHMRLAGPNPVFAWQGGEPALMGLGFYEAVVDLEQRLGLPGQVVGNGFQTNATLLDDDWASFFARYRFLVGVSLDGPRELHDLHRRTAGGAGTFDRVMAGVEALRRHRVEFNILCMVTRESVRRPEALYRFFRDRDLRYLQFIPLVEPGALPATPADFSITAAEYGDFLCRMFDQWSAEWPPEVSIREFDDFLAVYAGRPMNSCTFRETCGSYYVAEHNGDVYACDFMVEPRWRLGNLTQEPLAALLDSPLFADFAARKGQHGDRCHECPWLNLCHGGCQKHRLITGASVEDPSYFCEAYRIFHRHSHRRLRRMAERITASGPPLHYPTASATARAVGRNDPCPCGSGKKYKHCCLPRQAQGPRPRRSG